MAIPIAVGATASRLAPFLARVGIPLGATAGGVAVGQAIGQAITDQTGQAMQFRPMRRRTVDVAVDLQTGRLVLVPTARRRRRARGPRLRKTEREALESARRLQDTIANVLLLSVLKEGVK